MGAPVPVVDSSDVLDFLRTAEREAWLDFVAAPSLETRREHFTRLMALLREVDTRAMALLSGGVVRTSGKAVGQ